MGLGRPGRAGTGHLRLPSPPKPEARGARGREHSRKQRAATDWPRIAALYDGLAQINPSPVVELNRAVAAGRAFGPSAGLELVLPLFEVAALRDYSLLPAVAGDLTRRAGDHDDARRHFFRAASLIPKGRERTTRLERAARCAAHRGDSA